MHTDEEYGAVFDTDLHSKKTDIQPIEPEPGPLEEEKENAIVVLVITMVGIVLTYYFCV